MDEEINTEPRGSVFFILSTNYTNKIILLSQFQLLIRGSQPKPLPGLVFLRQRPRAQGLGALKTHRNIRYTISICQTITGRSWRAEPISSLWSPTSVNPYSPAFPPDTFSIGHGGRSTTGSRSRQSRFA